jgi:MYXO-CTERM domain-containing protein
VVVSAKPAPEPEKEVLPTPSAPDAGTPAAETPPTETYAAEAPAFELEGGGGGCSTGGHSPSGVGGVVGLLLGATLLVRRRR